MKRRLLLLIFLVLLSISNVMGQQLRVFTAGKTIMVPLRYFVERSGGKLDYNAQYDMVIISGTPHRATLIFNREDASIDEKRFNMEQPLMVRDGVGYIPIGFLAQFLGMKVILRTETGEAILKNDEAEIVLPCRMNSEYIGSPLHIEAFNGDIARIDKLLNDGAKIDELDSDGDTPITMAVFNLRVKTVTMLVERGANVNLPVGRWGMRTPLLSLVTTGGIEGYLWNKPQDKMVQDASCGLMQVLLASKVNKNAADLTGWTALHEAISRGKERESRLLLVSGVSPDAVVFGGYTPLMLAVDCGKTEMVRLLLKNYANPNLSDIRGETALMRAERQGRMEIASLLRNYGATK